MWSCPATADPPLTTTEPGSRLHASRRSSSVCQGASAATARTPYSAPSAPTQRTSVSVRLPYWRWASRSTVDGDAATRTFESSDLCATIRAKATPPPAPGTFVVRTSPGESPRSDSTWPTERHVRSHPPPALAGAMHSHPRDTSVGWHAVNSIVSAPHPTSVRKATARPGARRPVIAGSTCRSGPRIIPFPRCARGCRPDAPAGSRRAP